VKSLLTLARLASKYDPLGIVGAQLVDRLSMARTEFDDRVAIEH
jgi:hypothetical protein